MTANLHRLFRLILTSLAMASIMTGASVKAHERDFDAESTCQFELAGTEELCGWIEIATHDSCPLPTIAAAPVAANVEPTSADVAPSGDTDFSVIGSNLSAAASVACASVGISVEQIVEPFAMVSTKEEHSLTSIQQFIRWWDRAVDEAERLRAADEDSMLGDDVAGDEPSEPEPVDLESLGPSVLVHVGIEVQPISPLVGGAAMIVTIEESYLPYDLSSRDLKLWSVFPVSTKPFCVRSRAADLDTESMWSELDNLVNNQVRPVTTTPSMACYGSADCLLEELVWRLESWTEEDSQFLQYLDPVTVGRQCGRLASTGTRLAKRAAVLLATHLKTEKPLELSPAGEALLARAGAIEARKTESNVIEMLSIDTRDIAADIEPAAAQIAEAPVASTLR